MNGVRMMGYEVREEQFIADTFSNEMQTDKVNLPLRQVGAIISSLLPGPKDSDKGEIEYKTRKITSTIKEMLAQEVISGDGDDWHNLTVDLARRGYFDLACDILERGMKEFPKNTDLLGDYLEYGTSCGRVDQCKIYYKILQKIPKIKYTWRGFHFSVNWLTYLWEQSDSKKELERLEKEIKQLVADYRSCLPDDEESYRCEAEFYKTMKKHSDEITALKAAVDSSIPAPKCALRLAHIYFEKGEYEEALKYAEECLKASNSIQDEVNTAFVFYLHGLCTMGANRTAGGEYPGDKVNEVYRDFNLSLKVDDRSKFVEQIAKKASLLQNQTGNKIPIEYTKLREVLDARGMLG